MLTFCSKTPPVPAKINYFDLNVNLNERSRNLIEKEMAFLASKRQYVDKKLANMAIYFPIIEQIFGEEGIPKDFKYLCAQESNFVADAVSSSNAVGFWQFKEATATDFGLTVYKNIDERKNIVSSTRAAAKYLKKGNVAYQNWVSTLLSYRLGATGAKPFIPNSWYNAAEITITEDTDWYVIRNIAHFLYFKSELETYSPSGDYLFIYNRPGGKTFTEIAQELKLDVAYLKQQNLWCNTEQIPDDKNYILTVIVKKTNTLPKSGPETVLNGPFFDIETGYPILEINTEDSKKDTVFYYINGKKGILSKKGDTPEIIAKRAGVDLKYFLSYNDIDKNSPIIEKTVYYLKAKRRKAKAEFHTVKPGQNLWLISQMNGIKLKRLKRLNRLDKNEGLQIGRILHLRKRRKNSEAIQFDKSIKIPKGETYAPNTKPMIIENAQATAPSTTKKSEPKVEIEPVKTNVIDVPDGPARQVVVNQQTDIEKQNGAPKVQYKSVPNEPEKESKIETKQPVTTYNSSGLHVVKKGDTIYGISKMYGISTSDLQKWNGITDFSITENQTLIVKSPKLEAPKTNVVATPAYTKPTNTNQTFHIVQKGENLFRISLKYKVTLASLKKANNLTGDQVNEGQNLIIPKP